MQKAAQAYLQTQVTTTGQGDVVVLLYDGALKFLGQAKELLEANDMAGKGINISRALDVIAELDSSLNMEKGGDLARNLHGLYSFCQNHLVMANVKKNPQMIDDVVRVLSGLRSAYAEILSNPEAQAAAREAAAHLGTKAISVSRSQPGACASSGAAAPQPGANARMRASYAKASGNFMPRQAGEPQDTGVRAAGEPFAEAGPTAPQGESGQPAPEPEKQGDAARTASGEPASQASRVSPSAGGFAQRLGGSDVFRKYAAMHK